MIYMIHEPPIDKLAEKIGSKYALCVVASKRARQILDTSLQSGNETTEKPLTLAAEEIDEGKVTATRY